MDRKKTLLLFSYDYPPSNGGIARLCHEIAIGAKQYYDKVAVLTRKKDQAHVPYNYNEIDIVELPASRIKCELAAYRYLRNIRDNNEVDVLCGVWHPEGLISLISGMRNVFILGHGTEFLSGDSKFRKWFWLPFYSPFVLNHAKKVITNSNYTARLVSGITDKANVVAIPLAVNHNYFMPMERKPDSNKLKLCSVSRILKFKGHDFVIHTISELPETYLDKVELHIAGKGPYLNDLEILVEKLNLQNQVFLHKYVPDEELPGFYNQSDVFILCTRQSSLSTQVEGFGLVFLEAQSCGIPTIGANTGGIPDAIEQENGGWLIEQDNKRQLTGLIIKLIENKEYLEEQARKARSRVLEKCTWEYYCKKLFKEMNR
ncbi:MAG: glycosyltransferase family 4 protein [Tannerella sp.]|jgi:phosphatidylinositol alpha-1,6-mannosyltransferase|nr:glycosyltransferase family 4 protein [Tannerella sp.]